MTLPLPSSQGSFTPFSSDSLSNSLRSNPFDWKRERFRKIRIFVRTIGVIFMLDIGVEITRRNFPFSDIVKIVAVMDPEAANTARDSLNLAFHMSNLLDTGLDRHTLSVLVALCDLGLNPEALAAVVKELRREPVSSSLPNSSAPVAKP
ncbi:hypothetical protein NC653_035950 [Populus alba x Populus x berolinensis]|nr:hypothetical protein NC653_035950 [Populus alba x Populus x berolinensis]